jgi:hypothetical protein
MEIREMALQRFVKSSGTGDRYPTGDNLNKPVFVQPLEKFTGMVTEHDKDGTGVNLRANLYDLVTGQAYGRIVLFNDALVDGLGRYIGEEVVVRFADIKKKNGSGSFRGALEGTDADYKLAEDNLDEIHAAIEARLAELDNDTGSNDSTSTATDPAVAAKAKAAFKR